MSVSIVILTSSFFRYSLLYFTIKFGLQTPYFESNTPNLRR